MPKDYSSGPQHEPLQVQIPPVRQLRGPRESPSIKEMLENSVSPRRRFGLIRQFRAVGESSPCDPWTAKSETSSGFAADAFRAFTFLQLNGFQISQTEDKDTLSSVRSTAGVLVEKDVECSKSGDHSETATLAVSEASQSDDDMTMVDECKKSMEARRYSLYELRPAPSIAGSDSPSVYSNCDDVEARVTMAQPSRRRKLFLWTQKEWRQLSSMLISLTLLCFAAYKLNKK